MTEWLQQTDERRIEIINQVNIKTGISVKAIEKDWWVTLAIKAIFSFSWAENLVFKGGTSLSKAWGLTERFSEDIDLVMDRGLLGMPGEIRTRSQVQKLRLRSAEFAVEVFAPTLKEELVNMGVDPALFEIIIEPTAQPDIDPQKIQLTYKPLFASNKYLPDVVTIEPGARSLREPCSPRQITSIIGQTYPGASFSGAPFTVETVEPKRTLLEKIFLLHENFQKPREKWKHERLSRHHYDLHRLMNTEHAKAALADEALYRHIVAHRDLFNHEAGVDYKRHAPATIRFIPPDEVFSLWTGDFRIMRENMIYGQTTDFKQMADELGTLQNEINAIVHTVLPEAEGAAKEQTSEQAAPAADVVPTGEKALNSR
ncbi:nucleotidyl transferase AbiEii/AbiGii toxin family protein [Chitinophaga agrisoli]|uniref:Nucleotidyl transferase AbiEii/AbiGii toxin family protein n=1 Tax=Chitinophaga agrisoli TaxID=2607653 RepID=A0A5B2W124_9BACT|nr:nucleotidyl transferase AbiEii/AbiGii toxin family protein [Chitinophaga agrisoli]KAA2245065.1 nucleotidyl transferase AbiEii/AbiGii toxin family protein [Chitinophaga agrisoli]